MEQKKETQPGRVYNGYSGMNVDMYALEGAETKHCLLNGRALLNPERRTLAFVQNTPRGPRSKEVGRTEHGRYVCRPDGMYTLTMRFAANERNLREQLISEIRQVVTGAVNHWSLPLPMKENGGLMEKGGKK